MKILVFGASSSRESINRAFARHAAHRLQSEFLGDLEIDEMDLNDYEMPIYSIDRELEMGIPRPAQHFFEQVGGADGLVISYAEHNGFYSAAFKNIFDWASRIAMKVFQGTPKLALSTSIGSRGGANVLRATLESAPHFGAEIVASMSLPRFRDNFDVELGRVTNEEYRSKLGLALSQFATRLSEIGSEPKLPAIST
ncbi:MAG: NAD(P)H-dependent oxidoreductase [Myxococcota bacterium]